MWLRCKGDENMSSNVSLLPLREVRNKFSEVVKEAEENDRITIVLKRHTPTSAIISFKMLERLLGKEKIKDILYDTIVVSEVEKRVKDAANGNNILSEEKAMKELGWK